MKTTGAAFAIAAAFVLLLGAKPATAGLLGSSVTGTSYYPDLSTVYAGPIGPVTVGPGIEFPVNTVFPDGNINVTNTQVIWTSTQNVTYGSGSFNGFVLDFSGAPVITNVSVDAATTLPATSFSFSSDQVFLNLAGQSATVGAQTILDVTTASSSVPEPASLFLLGVGLAGLGCIRRARTNRS